MPLRYDEINKRCGRADEEGKNIKKKKVGWNEILRVSEQFLIERTLSSNFGLIPRSIIERFNFPFFDGSYRYHMGPAGYIFSRNKVFSVRIKVELKLKHGNFEYFVLIP